MQIISDGMLAVRNNKLDYSVSELIRVTVRSAIDSVGAKQEEMEQNKEAQPYSVKWTEEYIDNFALNRYGNIRFSDEIYFYSKDLSDEDRADLRESLKNRLLCLLPTPVMRLLGIGINKADYHYSNATYLYYKENKLHEELDEEIKRGDAFGESAEQVTTSDKLSKNNVRNLVLILIAEMLWFMSLNAVETFQTNYVMFWLNTSSAGGAIMTVISGAASVVGFLVAGVIADKIGRKWTIFLGICLVCACYVGYSFIPKAPEPTTVEETFTASLPWIFFILLPTT